MPRACTICVNPQRPEIDAALVAGTTYRNIAERFGTSLAAIFRHKFHAGQAIVKAAERREQKAGDSALDEIERIRQHAWELVSKLEQDGDLRGGVVALREVRESLETQAKLLALAAPTGVGRSEIVVTVVHLGQSKIER